MYKQLYKHNILPIRNYTSLYKISKVLIFSVYCYFGTILPFIYKKKHVILHSKL